MFLVKFIYIILKSFFLIITAGDLNGNACVFGTIADDDVDPELANYLDGRPEFTVRQRNDISQYINQMANNCEPYSLLTANCEHLATCIRYNVPNLGQVSGKLHIIPILHA